MKPNEQNLKQSLGKFGEALARDYLVALGYTICDMNFRIRGGELDIIALDHKTLVFVEVKTRKSLKFGLPVEAITPRKYKDTMHAIAVYIMEKNLSHLLARFDVMSIIISSTHEPKIEHIKNAALI